jgi:glycosyltransferase involved in cell wall biosynthesis
MSNQVNGLSIIIPTRNRAQSLLRTLKSLDLINDRLIPIELLIIDNSEPKNACYDLFTKLKSSYTGRVNIRFFAEDTPGLLPGRHRGFLESNYDTLAFIDDDIVFNPRWIEGILEAFSHDSVALCGGPTLPIFFATPPRWIENFWCNENPLISFLPELSLTIPKSACIIEIDPRFIFGLNFIIRRDVLQTAGGFHPDCVPGEYQHFQGDGETGLSQKIQKLGLRTIYHHEVRLLHQIDANRLTIEYFENRHFYQGVCDSYTSIRTAGGLPEANQNSTGSISPNLLDRVLRRIQMAHNRMKQQSSPPTEDVIVKRRCQAAYQRGFAFHQECARRSKRLREWILRRDYFDYSYPTLEEDYVPPKRQLTLSQNDSVI